MTSKLFVSATLAAAVASVAMTSLGAQGRGGARGGGPGAPGAGPRAGTIDRIVVHGRSLEKNLEGDSPDRDVLVYLPPSYAADTSRRFPVVYLLHGFDARENTFTEVLGNLPAAANRLDGAQGFSSAIYVMPNALTRRQASMYSSSATTGDWERFIAEDLVAHIDGRYRTLPSRMSRGLAGHAMGGYGALRIGMNRPDVFGSLYVMSACCVTPDRNPPAQPPAPAPAHAVAATEMLGQHADNLQLYYSVAIEIGLSDPLLAANRELHAAMTRLRIPHAFEEYDGDHTNRIGERIERNLLPFFARNLVAPSNPTSPSPEADRLSSTKR